MNETCLHTLKTVETSHRYDYNNALDQQLARWVPHWNKSWLTFREYNRSIITSHGYISIVIKSEMQKKKRNINMGRESTSQGAMHAI